MSWVDALVLAWVALSAVVGFQRGLTAQFLSLAGLALGGLAGARLGPLFLPDGNELAVGAVRKPDRRRRRCRCSSRRRRACSVRSVRWAIARGPFRLADSAGGVIIGIGVGLAVAWLAAVAALQIEGAGLRTSVQRSSILSSLVDAVPPRSVLRTLARLDPLPLISAPPDLSLPLA